MDHRVWLEQAQEDLNTARILIENGKYSASAFYSQQAAENVLRALLYLIGRDPGKTHSLTELAEALEQEGIVVPQNVKEYLMVVSPHFIISRYPDAANGVPYKQYNRNIAEDVYRRAKEVVEWALRESQRLRAR